MMASPVVVFWQQTICPEFSSQHPVPSQQFGHHIAIADLRPHERDMQFLQSQLQAEVAHQGADHTTLQPPAFLQVARDEEKQFVAIHDRTGMVDHHHPVAVAVEGDAEVGMVLDHRSLQAIQVSGAALVVDVQAIRAGRQHRHFRAQFPEDAGSDLVGSAVGAVEHDLETVEVGAGRHAALAEFDVAPRRVIDPRNLAETGGLHHGHRRIEQFLDHQLDVVRQLGPLPGEELDAVVVVGIVRSADHHPGLGVESPRQVGDAGVGIGPSNRVSAPEAESPASKADSNM